VTRQPFECIIKPPVAPIVPVILPGNTMDGAYVGLLGSWCRHDGWPFFVAERQE